MSEKSEEILPHHIQQTLCTTRLPYRQGRKLTAIKVYTINNESKHLLIFGVPSLNLRQETKALFCKFGKLTLFNVTAHQSEQFTETYHALYENIASARLAKRMLDTKNFYGGILHVCYAPELENIEETREKLILRQKNVIARLKNLQKDAVKPIIEDKIETKAGNSVNLVENTSKVFMGDVNNISFGKRKAKDKKLVKKTKKSVNKFGMNSHTSEFDIGTHGFHNTGQKTMIINEINEPDIETDNVIEKRNSSSHTGGTEINFKKRIQITDNSVSIDNLEHSNKAKDIEIIDFTSAAAETLTNINGALNYKNFGREVIKKIPYKPVNKIKFNINKNT